MLSIYSRDIEILHEVAIAPIPPHAIKSNYLRDWNTRLVTSLRQRISLPTFEGIRGLYLTIYGRGPTGEDLNSRFGRGSK